MGVASRASRRSLIDTTRTTVERVNDVVQQHNGILERIDEEAAKRIDGETALQKRLAAQGAMIETLESQVTQLRVELNAVIKFAKGVDTRCDMNEGGLSRVRGLVDQLAASRLGSRVRRLLDVRRSVRAEAQS